MTEIEQNVIEAARAVAKWNEENGQVNRLTGFQNLTLLEALVMAVNDYNAEQISPEESTMGPRVHAETHDDEYYHTVPSFDCTPWFEQAADEDIVALADCGWGGDYAADAVAEHFQYNNHYPEIVALFNYKRSGFECHVDETEALEWLLMHRLHLLHETGADTNGNRTYEVGLPAEETAA